MSETSDTTHSHSQQPELARRLAETRAQLLHLLAGAHMAPHSYPYADGREGHEEIDGIPLVGRAEDGGTLPDAERQATLFLTLQGTFLDAHFIVGRDGNGSFVSSDLLTDDELAQNEALANDAWMAMEIELDVRRAMAILPDTEV